MRKSQELRLGRKQAGLTQVEAAKRLRLSQGYLSLLEGGKRAVTHRVAEAAGRVYGLPYALPLPDRAVRSKTDPDRLVHQLAALGYPGYADVRPRSLANPAKVVLDSVSAGDTDARVTRAVPWVLSRYPDLNWKWLVDEAKLQNAQNRLGFLVSLARELVERDGFDPRASARLREVESQLESAKLAAESTLGRRSLSDRERDWMREHRPETARRWNVLSTLTAEQVRLAV